MKASLRDACRLDPGAVVDVAFCDQAQIDDMTADGVILIVPTTLDASDGLRARDVCAMLGLWHLDADGADLGYGRVGVLDRDGGSLAACGTSQMSEHPRHLWHEGADGRIRCAFQDCVAEPTAIEAAEVLADAEVAARMRVAIEYAARR